MLCSHKKWGNPVICDNTGGPWGHSAKWNKAVTERQMLSTDMWCTESHLIHRDRKWNTGCQYLWEEGMRSCYLISIEFQFGCWKFLELTFIVQLHYHRGPQPVEPGHTGGGEQRASERSFICCSPSLTLPSEPYPPSLTRITAWTIPPHLVCGKTVFHETSPWCQKGWGLLHYHILHDYFSLNSA